VLLGRGAAAPHQPACLLLLALLLLLLLLLLVAQWHPRWQRHLQLQVCKGWLHLPLLL
jgi:hypothetical protein